MGGRKPEGCLRKLSETCLKVFVVVLKRGGGEGLEIQGHSACHLRSQGPNFKPQYCPQKGV